MPKTIAFAHALIGVVTGWRRQKWRGKWIMSLAERSHITSISVLYGRAMGRNQ